MLPAPDWVVHLSVKGGPHANAWYELSCIGFLPEHHHSGMLYDVSHSTAPNGSPV